MFVYGFITDGGIEMAELTPKQKKFCLEYMIDLNATQAAIRAGYSTKGADVQAVRLLGNVKVKEYIREFLDKKDTETIAKADEVLKTLTRILRREEQEHVVIVKKTENSHYDKNGKKVVKKTEEPDIVAIPSKLSDTNKAAELLGRYYSMFTDNQNINGSMVIINGEDKLQD